MAGLEQKRHAELRWDRISIVGALLLFWAAVAMTVIKCAAH